MGKTITPANIQGDTLFWYPALNCKYDQDKPLPKDQVFNSYIQYYLARCQSMFKYDGLPDTIPAKWLEHYLFVNGQCVFIKNGEDLIVTTGGQGGDPDIYYIPTKYIVSNPYVLEEARKTYTIGEETYNFPQNNNGQTLHGGLIGLDMVVWNVDKVTEDSIVLSYLRPDGQEGMPGNLNIVMTYTLTPDNEFRIDYDAETDNATHVNISHHSFFNLKGEGNGTINDHVLYINASKTTPVDALLIPTGEIADVTGTPFDFREPKAIGQDVNVENEQLKNGAGYDHNWVLDRKSESGLELAASVWEPASGRYMEVWTDQPALQFYGGNFFDGTTVGKYGKTLNYRESLALETQKYPDTPHHAHFPSTLLNPGEKYTHACVYKFGVK